MQTETRSIPAGARRAAGLTLLELLVSITLLAAISVIVAALWAQSAAWASESRLYDEALRTQRVYDLMRDQWRRRASAPAVAPDETAPVRLVDSRFEFITSLSALFPGAPLVRASYVIERESDAPGARLQLVYEERRIVNVEEVYEGERDALGDPLVDRFIVFDGCESLSWEWAREEPAEDVSTEEIVRDTMDRDGDEPVALVPIAPIEWLPPLTLEETEAVRGKPEFAALYQMLGVRLSGERKKEPFGWTFVLVDSR